VNLNLTPFLAQEIVEKELRHGSIVKTTFLCHDGNNRLKFCIVLNHDISRDPLFYVLTTSQLSFHDSNPQYKQQTIRIREKELSCFPKATIIDCMSLYRLTKTEITTRYMHGKLTFCGALPDTYLKRIDNIIKTSPFIPEFQKNAILHERDGGPSH
jgi:hypothetical protein